MHGFTADAEAHVEDGLGTVDTGVVALIVTAAVAAAVEDEGVELDAETGFGPRTGAAPVDVILDETGLGFMTLLFTAIGRNAVNWPPAGGVLPAIIRRPTTTAPRFPISKNLE